MSLRKSEIYVGRDEQGRFLKGVKNRTTNYRPSGLKYKIKVKNKGWFKRKIQPWSLNSFNDGLITSKGRFKVYCPKHIRADHRGYVYRSIVAYETYHNTNVSPDYVVHHKDKNKLNDSKENLELMGFGEHTSFHCKGVSKCPKCM